MSVLFCGTYVQDFEAFLTAASPASMTDQGGGTSLGGANNAFYVAGGVDPQKFFDCAAPISTWGVHFGFRGLTTAVSGKVIFLARDNANSRDLFRLRTTSTGTAATCVFEIFNGSTWDSAGALAMTLESGSVSAYQISVVMHASAGSVIIRKNGAEQLNVSGINTAPTASTAVDQFLFGASHNGTGSGFSAVIVADEDPLAMEFLSRGLTTGTGLVAEWTGHNVTNVNGGEDTGITAPSADLKSTFNKANLGTGYDSHNILAVGVSLRARRTGAGPAGARVMVRNGTEEAFGATTTLGTTTTETATYDLFTLNPDGAVPWTRTTFDAMQVGVQSRAV